MDVVVGSTVSTIPTFSGATEAVISLSLAANTFHVDFGNYVLRAVLTDPADDLSTWNISRTITHDLQPPPMSGDSGYDDVPPRPVAQPSIDTVAVMVDRSPIIATNMIYANVTVNVPTLTVGTAVLKLSVKRGSTFLGGSSRVLSTRSATLVETVYVDEDFEVDAEYKVIAFIVSADDPEYSANIALDVESGIRTEACAEITTSHVHILLDMTPNAKDTFAEMKQFAVLLLQSLSPWTVVTVAAVKDTMSVPEIVASTEGLGTLTDVIDIVRTWVTAISRSVV